ncbi:Magnesium and cobalt efflux protein CorC [Posidoniimonas polymericola]|uniref:Magnesium and cobalt efflux protein CorC n=1 Tax=Posidoniimonas polymericola TaxID=2528002 RepID=A0A5C5YC61_9BACT|nr:CNNM domain-containing protein [Posidoniimonas polymericola]TWT72694.1 Magnesium and cobalt efflux protein CorC [Posidoniimonas polymericola]
MASLAPYIPHLIAMALLLAASAFFSCSEAALFYLGREERDRMQDGALGERTAARLLANPERLLTAILFWNLLVNMAYFALASLVAIGINNQGAASEASVLTVVALFAVIIFSEMLPKNFGVVWPVRFATLLSVPLSAAAKVLDPIAWVFGAVSRGSSRVLFPHFEAEPYLELGDLERAISLSGGDQQLIEQEQNVLSRIVALAETRIEEIMRPRLLYEALPPPVTQSQLSPQTTASGYVLVTEPDSEEIAAVIDVNRAALFPGESIGQLASPVLAAPWCASVAETLSRLDSAKRDVVAVVNELGETIGIVTRNDILGSVLHAEAARDRGAERVGRIRAIGDGQWEVTGMTTLRRLAKKLGCELPAVKGITVAGMLQEQLNHLPQEGDEVEWAGHHWRVLSADHPSLLTASVRRVLTPDPPQDS